MKHETITAPAAPVLARPAAAPAHALIIHAARDWFRPLEAGDHEFFRKLTRQAAAKGLPGRIVEAGSSASRLMLEQGQGQGHVHLIVGGAPGYGPGRLHARPAHVWGFWYLDEIGTGWHSSLRLARFHAAEMDADKAAYFFNGVTGYMLRENVSNRPQEPRLPHPLQAAAATIFCQCEEAGPERSHFLTTEQMLRVTATTASGARVYLKPHPDQPKLERKRLMDMAADYPNVTVTDASVHDLAQAAAVVVTQNSTAGFEALMQRKPVVTCGKSDYWHATLTPKTENDLRPARRIAVRRRGNGGISVRQVPVLVPRPQLPGAREAGIRAPGLGADPRKGDALTFRGWPACAALASSGRCRGSMQDRR